MKVSMKRTMKQLIYDYLTPFPDDPKLEKAFNAAMLILIALNVLAVIFETVEPLYLKHKTLFDGFEVFSVIIFTVEYILRIWSCTVQEGYRSPITGRFKFALRPMQLIDVLAILPFYLPFIGLDLRFIRVVRLFRLFRLFKVGRYSQSLATILRVIKAKKEELTITLFTGLVLLIFSSILMYLIEHQAQPDRFSSIPESMWWGAVTLTTVGYGDIYPITTLGKILGVFISILGIGLFALPAGIVASGFTSELQNSKKQTKLCPHCGKELPD